MPLFHERNPVHPYLVSGIRFELPCSLPLGTADPEGPALARIAVTLAPLPAPPTPEAPVPAGMGMWVGPGRVLFSLGPLGRLLADRESGLILDIEPDADPDLFAHYLCGHVMGGILHLSGVLPLHASCLAHPVTGRAVAISAPSGGGKSTLAAALRQRGWRPLADDVTAIAPNAAGLPQAWPGPPRFRLSPASMAAAGLPADAGVPLSGFDKRLVGEGGAPWHVGPAVLAAVIELTDGAGDRPLARLRDSYVAVSALSAYTFRRRLTGPLGMVAEHAARCLELARRVPVFSLARRPDLAQLGALADTVEEIAGGLGP